MAWDWESPMDKREMDRMKEFILYTFEGYKKWGKDRFIDFILHMMVRKITRIVGEYKNLKMSAEAEKTLGECYGWKDIERKKKGNPIVLDHDPPAKMFFEELKKKLCREENFRHGGRGTLASRSLNSSYYQRGRQTFNECRLRGR